jgi:RimJ/RimL family protein N-acetyltransferase
MTCYLETERLKLRAIDSSDARNLYELNCDPRVMEFLSPEYDTLEEAEAILPKVVARNERYGNQLGLFGVIEKGSEEFIGTFILRPDRRAPGDTKNLEIGYRLKQRWWGRGLGTEGSLALVERALAQFGARRIYVNATPGNRASIRIMEKIGLSFEKAYTETDDCGKTVALVMYSREYPSGPQSHAVRASTQTWRGEFRKS